MKRRGGGKVSIKGFACFHPDPIILVDRDTRIFSPSPLPSPPPPLSRTRRTRSSRSTCSAPFTFDRQPRSREVGSGNVERVFFRRLLSFLERMTEERGDSRVSRFSTILRSKNPFEPGYNDRSNFPRNIRELGKHCNR